MAKLSLMLILRDARYRKRIEDLMITEAPKTEAIGEAVIVDETRAGQFQVAVKAGPSTFLADEPVAVGGLGSGPTPYDLLSAALGSCTLMTIRLSAARKKLPLSRVRVNVTHHRSGLDARDVFAREILLEGELDDAQKAKLVDIAEHCPVHVSLHGGSDIQTTLVQPDRLMSNEPSINAEHMKIMEETCEK
jgi:putative redox protein